jgi:CRP/FNR family transcriptional regulator, cyclic AMP receptor protein
VAPQARNPPPGQDLLEGSERADLPSSDHRRRPDPLAPFSEAARTAWTSSFLGQLPPRAGESLLEQARETTLLAGQVFYSGANHSEMVTLALVVDGLLRTYIQESGGRQVTIRYVGPGAIVGIPAVVVGGPSSRSTAFRQWLMVGGGSIHGEALQDTRILRLVPERFESVAKRDAAVSWALAQHLAREVAQSQQILAGDLFLPIKNRVAYHLLDLAIREDGGLLVRAGHQELANAIGSVREVVSRTLLRMQREGLIARRDGALVLLDPRRLHELASGEGA